MDPLLSNTGLLPPALRALALGLLVETAVPLLNRPRQEPGRVGTAPPAPGRDERGAGGKAELCQALRCKCSELSGLVLRADDPGEAAAFVLDYLPKHFEYVFGLFSDQERRPAPAGFAG